MISSVGSVSFRGDELLYAAKDSLSDGEDAKLLDLLPRR